MTISLERHRLDIVADRLCWQDRKLIDPWLSAVGLEVQSVSEDCREEFVDLN